MRACVHRVVFELVWRDYYRFLCLKHGSRVFAEGGLTGAWHVHVRNSWVCAAVRLHVARQTRVCACC